MNGLGLPTKGEGSCFLQYPANRCYSVIITHNYQSFTGAFWLLKKHDTTFNHLAEQISAMKCLHPSEVLKSNWQKKAKLGRLGRTNQLDSV